MTKPKYAFTPEGYERLKQEYQDLSTCRRPLALTALAEARGMGSLEDNLQYDAAKAELELIDGRIAELEEMLKQGKIASRKKADIVGIGSRVTLQIDNEPAIYIIVNPYESDPVAGKISYESPVGKALLNRKPGEAIAVTLPHATLEYIIINVE